MQLPILRTWLAVAAAVPSFALQQLPLFQVVAPHETIAALGDVDGDGTLEVALGVPSFSGPKVAVHRVPSGELLYELPGPSGVGRALAGLGDVDGDGLPDWVVGGSGPVTIYRGYDGQQLHSFLEPNTTSGIHLADAGDVDGDGTCDVLIGFSHAYDHSVGASAGAAYVYSGRTKALIHRVFGTKDSRFGSDVDGAGDVNGDGYADFVVGAYREDSPSGVMGAGVVRILSGLDASVLQTYSVDDSYASFGLSVAGLGDVDGDGVPDVAAGGPTFDDGSDFDVGTVRVFSSASGALLHDFQGIEDEALFLVASAGDFDGDGLGDFTVAGEPSVSSKVSVYSGRTGGLLIELSGPPGFGTAVTSAGDMDGDGLPDLLVGRINPGWLLGYLGHRGIVGGEYCAPAVANSTGKPADLFTSGSDVLNEQKLRVSVQSAPAGTVGLLLASQKTGLVQGPGGSQGTLCLKLPIARFVSTARVSTHAGTFAWDVDLLDIPGVGPVLTGQTWNFQAWYRDSNPGPTSNFSDASTVLFQ